MRYALPWYVAVDDVTAGPAPTDLVIKGIEHRKIPPEAFVCEVGAARWRPLAEVDVFHAAVIRSYPPPPPDSEEARRWLSHGFHFPAPAPLPQFDYPLDLDSTPVAAAPVAAAPAARRTMPPPKPEPDIDVDWDDVPEGSAIDWSHPFESYFLLSDDVALPEERALLESLSAVSRETLRQEGALWNLALCLAYGSDDVGLAAARAFFEAAAAQGGGDPLDWMSRTLLSKGFVPSGIPEKASRRALERLRSTCPPALTSKLL